jgi:hypothetical protein
LAVRVAVSVGVVVVAMFIMRKTMYSPSVYSPDRTRAVASMGEMSWRIPLYVVVSGGGTVLSLIVPRTNEGAGKLT